MKWNRECVSRIFSIAWRVSILLLPWQARWFVEGSSINGFPWEAGRISIYASWVPMAVTIVCSFLLIRFRHSVPLCRPGRNEVEIRDSGLRREDRGKARLTGAKWIPLFFGVVLFSSSLFTLSSLATFQWWLQVLLLGLFVWSLRRERISSRTLAFWFVLSIVPHALLGIWQYAAQFVYGTKWLGIATQDPLVRGVSVVEVAGARVLRAYGGFPHPNIFGAWLAIGLLVAMRTFVEEITKYKRWFFAGALVLFTIALVLTFSRTAWIAGVVGIGGMIGTWGFSRRKPSPSLPYQGGGQKDPQNPSLIKEGQGWISEKRSLFVPLLFILLSLLPTLFFTRHILFTRLSATARLENISINEREVAMKQGWQLFLQHPWFGVGPNATELALSRMSGARKDAPMTPPHFVPLLILDEVGVVGAFGILCLIIYSVWHFCRKAERLSLNWLSFFLPILIFCALDHFLWSYWAGMGLVAMTLIIVGKNMDALHEGD